MGGHQETWVLMVRIIFIFIASKLNCELMFLAKSLSLTIKISYRYAVSKVREIMNNEEKRHREKVIEQLKKKK